MVVRMLSVIWHYSLHRIQLELSHNKVLAHLEQRCAFKVDENVSSMSPIDFPRSSRHVV